MSYCGKECQRQHWEKVHSKHCKNLRGEGNLVKHNAKKCRSCKTERVTPTHHLNNINYPSSKCHIQQVTASGTTFLGQKFGYHGKGSRCGSLRRFPGTLPFEVGELTGIYRGGIIEEAEAHILKLLFAVISKIGSPEPTETNPWIGIFKQMIFIRFNAWGEELIIGGAERTRCILGSEDHMKIPVKEVDKLCTTEPLLVWRQPIVLALYTIQSVTEMYTTQNIDQKAIQNLESRKQNNNNLCAIIKDNEERREIVNQIINQKCTFPLLKWPYRNKRYIKFRKVTAMLTTLEILRTKIIPRDNQVLKKELIEFYSKARTCHECLKVSTLTHRCRGCKAVQYCSKTCQIEDWQHHAKRCREWKNKGTKRLPNKEEQEEKLRIFAERIQIKPHPAPKDQEIKELAGRITKARKQIKDIRETGIKDAKAGMDLSKEVKEITNKCLKFKLSHTTKKDLNNDMEILKNLEALEKQEVVQKDHNGECVTTKGLLEIDKVTSEWCEKQKELVRIKKEDLIRRARVALNIKSEERLLQVPLNVPPTKHPSSTLLPPPQGQKVLTTGGSENQNKGSEKPTLKE